MICGDSGTLERLQNKLHMVLNSNIIFNSRSAVKVIHMWIVITVDGLAVCQRERLEPALDYEEVLSICDPI